MLTSDLSAIVIEILNDTAFSRNLICCSTLSQKYYNLNWLIWESYAKAAMSINMLYSGISINPTMCMIIILLFSSSRARHQLRQGIVIHYKFRVNQSYHYSILFNYLQGRKTKNYFLQIQQPNACIVSQTVSSQNTNGSSVR